MGLQARRLAVAALALGALLAAAVPAAAESGDAALRTAQAEDAGETREDGTRPLEPRYQPREPGEHSWYNGDYIFGMTRGVTGSTLHPAVKAPLLILTIPLDLALLPFAAIGGLFG